MKKLILWICCLILIVCALGAAVWFVLQNNEDEEGYKLYYLSEEEDQLVSITHQAEESDPSALAAELYLQQQTLPEKNKDNVKLLLPENITLLNMSLDNNELLLDFSDAYSQMSAEREILVRAGMVRLFTQIPDIKKVLFLVDGESLKDADGQEIGAMTAGRFAENSGKNINSYLKTTMTLYFADQDSSQLLPEERTVYYNSNVPLERVVVEQLIKGPKEENLAATLPPELNILSVTIQDDICYVNLDDSFKTLLEMQESVLNPELSVYSIVNSVSKVCSVSKVQISVNGKTNLQVGSVELNNLFSERTDLIRAEEEEQTEETGDPAETDQSETQEQTETVSG